MTEEEKAALDKLKKIAEAMYEELTSIRYNAPSCEEYRKWLKEYYPNE
jgi:hypothetical protein